MARLFRENYQWLLWVPHGSNCRPKGIAFTTTLTGRGYWIDQPTGDCSNMLSWLEGVGDGFHSRYGDLEFEAPADKSDKSSEGRITTEP